MADIDLSSLAATPPLSDEAFDAARKAGGGGGGGGGSGGGGLIDVVGMNKLSAPPAPKPNAAAAVSASTATATASATTNSKATLPRLHHLQWKFMDETAVYAQVIELGGGSRWIWIGSGDAKFSNLNLSLAGGGGGGETAPTGSGSGSGGGGGGGDAKIPPVTSFIGKSVGFSQALTQRLAVVCAAPVYVSYNLPSHNPLLEAFVQKKLTEALKALGLTAATATGSSSTASVNDSKSAAVDTKSAVKK